ncbi:MAG: HigA family addiction module antidote protein [Fusobacteriaceae bacterium]|jgi:addiction module HigA family antidote|nr:HigA family addiction module antidote protein [Fusobacteriaceae bacterium]
MNRFYYDNGHKVAIHPGAYLADIMEERELSLSDFAEKLDWDPESLKEFMNGDLSVTEEIAANLFEKLGIHVEMWMKFQKKYDMILAKERDRKTPTQGSALVESFK